MKVALIAHLSEISGAGVALLGRAKGLNRDRFTPVLILPAAGPLYHRAVSEGLQPIVVSNPEFSVAGSKLSKLPQLVSGRLQYIRQLANLLQREKFDAAFINSTTSIFAGLAARRAGIPIVWQSHEKIENPTLPTRLKLAYIRRVARGIAYDGQSAFDTFPPPPATPWCVTRNFTDVQALAALASSRGVPQSPTPGKPLRLLANGLFHRKGADLLLQAVAHALARNPDLNLEVILAGGEEAHDPTYIQALKHSSGQSPLAGRVTFAGAVPDLSALMLESHAFISPSRNEACPLSIVEALAIGLPVISTEVGQCARLLDNGRGGFLVPSEDIPALTSAFCTVAENYPTALERARAGQQHILQLYNKNHFFADVEDLLQKVANPPIAPSR